jgi:hypothetical protein
MRVRATAFVPQTIAPPKLTRENMSTPERRAKFFEEYQKYALAYEATAE